MKEYVCGFVFCQEEAQPRSDMETTSPLSSVKVLLLEKQRPAFQRGLLNGVGGSMEFGETSAAAMDRECWEEAGLKGLNWRKDSVLLGDDWAVHFFSTFVAPAVFEAAEQKTDEVLFRMHVQEALFSRPIMPNLRVLIPLALDRSGICKPAVLYDRVKQIDERAESIGIRITQDAFGSTPASSRLSSTG